MNPLITLILTIAAIVLAGCSVHKVNEEPDGLLPEYNAYTDPPVDTSVLPTPWWTAFNDEELSAVIEEALGSSYQVARFVARYEQAQALTVQARALRFPAVDAVADETIDFDEDDFNSFTDLGGALAWEIDIFNRLGYQESAFQSEAETSSEELEAVKLSLSAEIAETYYSAIEEKLRLALLRDQRERDELLLDLTKLRFAQGVSSAVDILQQKSQLEETISFIPTSEAALRVFENRLDVLTGVAPDESDLTPDEGQFPDLGLPPDVGVPSALLLERPDLKALKYDLVAADNRIGQAIAERLPNITLTGDVFYNLGSGGSGPIGLIIGSLVQPLIDWGLREAQVTQNEALYREQLALFAEAYITAIEEVENALYLEKKQRELLEVLRARRDTLQQTANETRHRYMQGLTDYLPVLTAVQELREIDRDIIRQERLLIGYRIRLYRALGGPVDDGPGSVAYSGGSENL